MNFSVQTINSYFWSYQSLVKITKKVWVTLQTLFICILISISAGHVEAKEINQNAVSYAEDYFNLNLAEDLFGGIKISTALKKTNRSDFKFLGEGQQDGVKQIAYLSLKPDFMMVTVSKIVTSDDILSVNITKLDTDIPFFILMPDCFSALLIEFNILLLAKKKSVIIPEFIPLDSLYPTPTTLQISSALLRAIMQQILQEPISRATIISLFIFIFCFLL